MAKLLNHPWTIAAGGALLTVALAEVGPLHLFSGHVIPWARALLIFSQTNVVTPAWVLLAGPLIGAALVVLGRYAVDYVRRKKRNLLFAGLEWRKSTDDAHGFWPICNQCILPLQPRIEPEQRKDRNNIPFEFIPEYVNVLHCAGCNHSSHLLRPWDEILQEANVFLNSLPTHSLAKSRDRTR
jgi:hypothetical protein